MSGNQTRNYRAPLTLGIILLGVVLIADTVPGLDPANSTLRIAKLLAALAGVSLLGWGISGWQKHSRYADERFLVHRLKASRAALVAGLLVLCGWLVTDLVSRGQIQWEIFLVLGTIAATKIAAMVYYQRAD